MFDYELTSGAQMKSDTQQISRGLRQEAQRARMLAATQKRNSREVLGDELDTVPVLRDSVDVVVLETLVEQYQYRLVRYLIYLLGRRDGVDDLVQEIWLRVLERGSSYDGHSRFEPWLFRIARNIAVDDTRKRRLVSMDSNDDDVRPATVSDQPSPFTLAVRTEDAARLARSLEQLEPVCREALVLRFQEDLSLQEISAIVGAPVSTVASRIYSGLAALRPLFEGETA
jgi:RNA polymerase sigma-70 factor (ECF subfamily)